MTDKCSTGGFNLELQHMLSRAGLRKMQRSLADVQESRCRMDTVALSPESLAEMIQLIEGGTISGKIGKQILPKLLQVVHHRLARHLLI